MGLSIMIWCILVYMVQGSFAGFPRSVFIIYGFSTVLYILAIRSIFSYILNVEKISAPISGQAQKSVLIYGAGVEGIQLYNNLKSSENYKLVGFIDENKSLWGQRLYETYVSAPEDISRLIESQEVKEVFLAHPKMTSKSKQVLLNKLLPLGVQLKVLPTLKDLASGRATISDFKHFELADLLRRNKNQHEGEAKSTDLKDKNLVGKSVMVTGAGGSVGSELVKQIAQKHPKRIILFERSELALYQIEHELQKIRQSHMNIQEDEQNQSAGFEIVTVLGNITDQNLVQRTIASNQVKTIYHAAAYKLIPFIEQHPLTALENNIIGTGTVATIASQLGVELFIYVSTDQAHEPGHIMGASKRFSEKHLKALASSADNNTVFSSVRFGNVLGSGDSVVELFSQQIRQGGPVTVTDPEMSRHFMTMGEATRLILEAGGMAKGGELFRLDKGQPIKIMDLAKSLISLSGNEVATDSNSQNGIAIEIIGLREGEKLVEETDYDRGLEPTSHSKIHLCKPDNDQSLEQLEEQLNQLKSALKRRDHQRVKQILCTVVKDFKQCA